MDNPLTHFNEEGRARMVDVGEKSITQRIAIATGEVYLQPSTMRLIKDGGIKKGDVLAVAQVAGIMGAKKTSDIIPMCHPLLLTNVDIAFNNNSEPDSKTGLCYIEIKATVKVNKAIIDAENRVLYPIINNMGNKTSRIMEGKNNISGTPYSSIYMIVSSCKKNFLIPSIKNKIERKILPKASIKCIKINI